MDDTPETTPPTLVQKLTAEAVGTAVFVFVGCAAITLGQGEPALAFGLALAAVILAFGRISGGHFNPAVTLGNAAAGKQPWNEAGLYVAAQFVGGIVAAIVLFLTLLGQDGYQKFDGDMGQNYYGDQMSSGYKLWATLLLELVLTLVFVLVVLGIRDVRQTNAILAPLVIGFTYTALVYAAFSVTGGSMNPARSFGPALFAGKDALLQFWPFVLAPALGGVLAGFVHPLLFGRDADPVVGSGFSFASSSSTGQPDQSGYAAGGYPPQQWAQPQQGYGAPQTGAYPQAAAPAPAPTPTPAPQPVEQPIIQDGWQWDPQNQKWIPAQQPAGGWPAGQGGGESTQIRPPDGV